MLKPRSESSITRTIQKYLQKTGAWEYKTMGSPYTRTGVPDLLVCYKGVFIGLEIKVPGEDPTKIQQFEIAMIKKAGGISLSVSCLRTVQDIIEKIDTMKEGKHETNLSRH